MRFFITALSFFILTASTANAQDYNAVAEEAAACRSRIAETGLHAPWNCHDPLPTTLREAIQYQMEYLPADNIGYTTGHDNPACDALVRAGFAPCNFNTRGVLAGFLAMYGKDLFPTDYNFGPGGTAYYGTAEQNLALIAAIERNAALFSDGDLTAEEVQLWE